MAGRAKTLADALEQILDIQAESAKRMAADGEEAISATVAMMSFEAAPPRKGRRGRKPPQYRGRPSPPSSLARAKTASSIGSVSLPVKVFCWLGW